MNYVIKKVHPEKLKSLIHLAKRERVPIKDTRGEWWAALEGNEFIGFSNMTVIGSSIRFRSSFVAPECRGMGVYASLWAVRYKEALKLPYKRITAYCTPMSIGIFKKHGFSEVSKKEGSDIIFLEKKL